MRILLIGNPNVGKSAIFNHLTGLSVTTSNYPGTTVNYSKGSLTYNGARYDVIDVPGTYQLHPESESERVAVDMIGTGDILANVVDATNLERNLNLTLQLMEYGKPMMIILNMWDDAKHKGIGIDVKKLERHLGIPVIPTNGLTGEGLNLIQEKLPNLKAVRLPESLKEHRWDAIGRIVTDVQCLRHRHHTFAEVLQDISIHPWFGPLAALVILLIAFKLIITVGEFLIGYIGKLFEIVYVPFIMWLSELLGGGGIIHSLLIGEIAGGAIELESAMGVLTTGVFVVFGIVLPYIIMFYLVFGFLEDLGYLPRVGIILDRLLHRIGLHGYSVIPMLLACGCKVPGILAIRNLETRRERFITAVITCVTIPCMAQTALILQSVGQRGGIYVALFFMTLLSVWVILGMVLNQTVKGNTPTLIMEVPPYRIPGLKNQMKKIHMRIRCFFREAIPYVLGGILFINLLHVTGAIVWVGRLFSPFIRVVFGLPDEAIAALLIGILRKDAAIALLNPIGLDNMQMVTAAVVLTLYFPCIATFAVLLKELGIRDVIKAVAIMSGVTLFAGGILNLLGGSFAPGVVIIMEILFIGICAITLRVILRMRMRMGMRVGQDT